MVAEARIAVMRPSACARKFAAWRLRKVAASRLRKVASSRLRQQFDAARLSNDKPAKRLKTSQMSGSGSLSRNKQDKPDERAPDKPAQDSQMSGRGHAARQDIHRLNTPSEDERAQAYLDDIDRDVLGPNYKKIFEVYYTLCRTAR